MWLQLDRPFSEAELRDAEAAAASSDTAKIAESCLVGVEGTDPATWFEGFTTQFGGAVAPRTLGGAWWVGGRVGGCGCGGGCGGGCGVCVPPCSNPFRSCRRWNTRGARGHVCACCKHVTAPIVAEPREACEPLTNEVEGHVAVVYRGTCPMIDKVRAAQAKGATAVMIVNHPLQGASRAIGASGAKASTTCCVVRCRVV